MFLIEKQRYLFPPFSHSSVDAKTLDKDSPLQIQVEPSHDRVATVLIILQDDCCIISHMFQMIQVISVHRSFFDI